MADLGNRYGYDAVCNGEHFDSQTEAAWASYFSVAGIPYVHEPETFDFGRNIWYTPDFYLPEQDSYFEVKNGNADWLACYKAATLARSIGKAVLLAQGKPHNLLLYIFGPESRKIADPGSLTPAVDYSDIMIHRRNIGLDVPRSQLAPLTRDLHDLLEASKRGWYVGQDPELYEISKQRKSALHENRRVFRA